MTSPEGGQSARALVGGLDADDRVGDARGIVVLHVLSDAAQFMQDRHADLPEMLGITDPRQLQDVQRADRARRQDHLPRRIGPLDRTAGTAAREFDRDVALKLGDAHACAGTMVTTCRTER